VSGAHYNCRTLADWREQTVYHSARIARRAKSIREVSCTMSRSNLNCCVCDAAIEGEAHELGGRPYCKRHYESVTREKPAAAAPILQSVVGVVVFVALVAFISSLTQPMIGGAALVVIGIVLALEPAAFWLAAFYRLDRLDPEPKRYVVGIFILGALLAQALGQPVIRDVFHVQTWLGADLITTILGSILIVGFVQEFLKYAAVRYTVFSSAEFDARVDGIVYCAAAGLGYATTLNIQYVVSNGGVDLGVGAIHVAVASLAQASLSGIVGYFLGRAKFESMGPVWLPMGLTLAAALNGVVTLALREVTTLGGLEINPWYGLVAAAVFAGAIFFILFTVIRRLNARELAPVVYAKEGTS
jgi:protease PrsW